MRQVQVAFYENDVGYFLSDRIVMKIGMPKNSILNHI